QMRNDMGRDNVLYVHVTLLPYISSTKELKTKPTQHSVKELRAMGIQPDVILCRSDYPMNPDIKAKLALFCDVEERAVIPLPTVSTIYEVPLLLESAGLGDLIVDRLNLPVGQRDMEEWYALVEKIKEPRQKLPIAIVGKYVGLQDAYYSVREALHHAALHHGRDADIHWVDAEEIERGDCETILRSVSGIVVPGGFGYRGIEGKIKAAHYARENKIPYLGLCLGMQVMVIEFARHILQSEEPNSTEFNFATPYPVIDLLPEQRDRDDMGGTMRLGVYPCHLVPGTRAADAYGQGGGGIIYERHRHRYEFNNEFRDMLVEAGLIISGHSPDGRLVEISEIKDHPWMVGVQFHPEFKSRPNRPHPLFLDFIAAAKGVLHEGDQPALPLEAEA
ncbi:MAG: CTP synthase, partial [Dehalococcoidia bacterium]|nr:CTP synthase [Dehalococcoidia bacterium]